MAVFEAVFELEKFNCFVTIITFLARIIGAIYLHQRRLEGGAEG